MKFKMRKTLNVLYPDEFGKRARKKTEQGFFSRRWNSFKLYLSGIEKPKLVLGTLVMAGVCLGGYSVYAYNHFTAYMNNILTAHANIEKEKQRRNDLINNLIPPALNYSIFEKELFSHVVEIRKELTSLNSAMAENADGAVMPEKFSKQLPALMGIFENYPDLKASKPFSDLMQELIATENRVAGAREIFNKQVNTYNTYIAKLPAAWVARGLNYEPHPRFQATKSASSVPSMEKLDLVNAK